MSTSRKRPASPPSSSSSSDADDPALPRLPLLGTPLDPSERSHRRAARQRAERGRVGGQQREGEGGRGGFVPAVFVSSRGRRAAQKEVGVEEYRDEGDEEGKRREALQVRGDIEGGGTARRRGRVGAGEDPLLATLEPRHDSIAMRMLRRMRLSGDGGRRKGRGGKAGPLPAQGRVDGGKTRPKRKLYTVALPPSMQAMMEEDAEEEKLLTTTPQPTLTAVAEDDEAESEGDVDDESLSPLPSIPLFSATPKADRHGLGYDPLAYASEFRDHRARERERKRAAEDADLLDGDVLDVWMANKGTGGSGKAQKPRAKRVPGFLVGRDEEDDDEVDVYDDRTEYDEAIGRSKVDRGREREEEERKAEALSAAQEPLTFVRAKESSVQQPSIPVIQVPDGWDERKRWDEREVVEAIGRMKEAVREYAEKSRRDREERQQQRRDWMRGREQQQQLQRDEGKEEGRPLRDARAAASAVAPPLSQPLPPPPLPAPPPAAAAFPTTEEMLASGFFSKFTASSDAPTSSTNTPHAPQPPVPPSSAPTASALSSPPKIGRYGPETREVQPWQPMALLCRRLGVEMPVVERGKDATTTRGTGEEQRSTAQTGTRGGRGKGAFAGREEALERAEEVELRAPPLVVDRPSPAVFKAIFNEADDPPPPGPVPVSGGGAGPTTDGLDEALQLLSSIAVPAAPSQSSLRAFVHPSRQHLVPAAPAPVQPPAPSEPRLRPSRWGGKASVTPLPSAMPLPLPSSMPSPPPLSALSFPPSQQPSAPPPVLRPSADPPLLTAVPPPSTSPAAPPAAFVPSSAGTPSLPAAAAAVPSLKASLMAELAKLEEQSAAAKARKEERRRERKERKERRQPSSRKSSKKEMKRKKKHGSSSSSRSTRVEYDVDSSSSSSLSSLEMRQVVDLT